MGDAPRLMTRADLRGHLRGVPWREVLDLIDRGKLPRPLWRLPVDDRNARWDRQAVDRALDAESAIPASIESQERSLDLALGTR